MNVIHKRIKQFREEARLTQKQLADAIGVSQATVAQYEKSPLKKVVLIRQ